MIHSKTTSKSHQSGLVSIPRSLKILARTVVRNIRHLFMKTSRANLPERKRKVLPWSFVFRLFLYYLNPLEFLFNKLPKMINMLRNIYTCMILFGSVTRFETFVARVWFVIWENFTSLLTRSQTSPGFYVSAVIVF